MSDLAYDGVFGFCPLCWRHDDVLAIEGLLLIGPDIYFACDKHKVKWLVDGFTLFGLSKSRSSANPVNWIIARLRRMSETEIDSRWRKYEEYSDVDPHFVDPHFNVKRGCRKRRPGTLGDSAPGSGDFKRAPERGH